MGEVLRDILDVNRGINGNLVQLTDGTSSVIRRQNFLVGLFILVVALMGAQLTLGLSQQRLQEAAKGQLAAVEAGREELLRELGLAKIQVSDLQGAIEKMRQQIQSVPVVTTDRAGRLNLEVPIADAHGTDAAPKVSPTTGLPAPPDKLVIPLKTGQPRLAN